MVTYPISVKRNSYRGSDRRKKEKAYLENQVAMELEKAINELLKNQKEAIRSYGYHEIASQTGVALETVRKLCFSIDCGHNGFTATRVGLTQEEYDLALKGDPVY
jgi:hypothetical protein